MPRVRADREGQHRTAYQKNRKTILASQSVCAICGKPVDKELKAPDPLSPTVDHIVPINKGGHPSALENLQLAHWICNRMKSDKLIGDKDGTRISKEKNDPVGMDDLPQSRDWRTF